MMKAAIRLSMMGRPGLVYRCTRCPSLFFTVPETARHLRSVHRLAPGAKLIAELAVLESAAMEAEAAADAAVAADDAAVAGMAQEADGMAKEVALMTEEVDWMLAAASVVEANILAPRLTFEDVCEIGIDDREEAFLTIDDEDDGRRLFDGLFDWML